MGSFTLHADFNQLDGGATLTKSVTISTNVQVIGTSGTIFEGTTTVNLVDGVLNVSLPATDNDPGTFGYTIRRAIGLTKVWRVPAQAPGVTVELTDYTDTTPLPVPSSGPGAALADFNALRTGTDTFFETRLGALFAPLPKVASTVSASGPLVVNKHNPVSASAANRTMTLPTGQTEGTQVSVEKTDSSVNTVTISGNIRGVGSSTIALAYQNEALQLRADSAGSWWPIAGHRTKASLDATYRALQDPITSLTASTATGPYTLAPNAVLDVLLDVNWTLALSGATAGKLFGITLRLKQGGTGSKTFTPPSGTTWAGGGSQPALQTTVGAVDVVRLETWDGGTTWLATLVGAAPVAAGTLLASASYDGGSTAGSTWTATTGATGGVSVSRTMTAIDTTRFAVTFTAPQSGRVDVTMNGYGGSAGAWVANYGLVDTSGNYIAGSAIAVGNNPANVFVRVNPTVRITGLTAGQSYTWYWAFNCTTGNYTLYASQPITSGNVITSNSGTASFRVYAA